MKVLFRTDSSTAIGSGHVMRCLTLANMLAEKGYEISFVSRRLPGCITDFASHTVYWLPDGEGWSWEIDAANTIDFLQGKILQPEWLIVDNYRLDARWETQVRPYVRNIMVIDDLADRSHECDLLLDQDYYVEVNSRYDNLVPRYCRKLLGPGYALLRPEFVRYRNKQVKRDGIVRRILVFFGSGDSTNETVKALRAIQRLNRPDIKVDVVVGKSNPYRLEIADLCKKTPSTFFHCQVNNMAELMSKADLAIGAGGTATWERCYLGLPCITVTIADNQAGVTTALAAVGATYYLGPSETVSEEYLFAKIADAIDRPEDLVIMGKKAVAIMGSDHPNIISEMELCRSNREERS